MLYTVPADHIVSVSNERPGALQLLGVVLLGGGLVFLLLFVFSSEVLKGIPEVFFVRSTHKPPSGEYYFDSQRHVVRLL